MSFAAHYPGDAEEIRGTRRFLAGVGISILVHLMLLLGYHGIRPSRPAPEPDLPRSIAIRIVPPAPPPRVNAAPQPRADAASARSTRKSTPKPVIAVPASPQQQGAPDAFTVQQAEEPAAAPADTPQFSMDDARQTARQLANQTKLGREGNANAQFPEPPLETESKFAKAISKAKRRNCKDGVPGGLLAPLFLMMDKKDSGCKW